MVLLALPAAVHADADIVQDSCVVYEEGGKNFIRVYFSVINFALPVPVCDLHFTPEPLPVVEGCEMLECGSPAGWMCFLDPLGGADWFALTPDDCIPTGGIKGGFYFVLDPAFCCYIVLYTDPTGAPILEDEVCFDCMVISNEVNSWGQIKLIYR
jgi:hypothetical protein